MKTKDMILDVLSDVDAKYIEEHARRTRPMKRGTKYAMAAAGYIAACLVVALLIPLITGTMGDVPPGGHSGITPGTQVSGDENEEEYPEKVTVYEVEKMIEVARKACNRNGVVLLQDGTGVAFGEIPEGTEFTTDEERYNYYIYINSLLGVLQDMMEIRFPEKSIYPASELKTHVPQPTYYYLDLSDTVFVNAEDAYNKVSDAKDGVISPDDLVLDEEPVTIGIFRQTNIRGMFIGTSEEMTQLFPTEDEQKIADKIMSSFRGNEIEEHIRSLSQKYSENRITTAELVKRAFEEADVEVENTDTTTYPNGFDPESITSVTIPEICTDVSVKFSGTYSYSPRYAKYLYTYEDEGGNSYTVAENGVAIGVYFTERAPQTITDEENRKLSLQRLGEIASSYLRKVLRDYNYGYVLYERVPRKGTSNDSSVTYTYVAAANEYYFENSIVISLNAAGQIYEYIDNRQLMKFDGIDYKILKNLTKENMKEYAIEKFNNKELPHQQILNQEGVVYFDGELEVMDVNEIRIYPDNQNGGYYALVTISYKTSLNGAISSWNDVVIKYPIS